MPSSSRSPPSHTGPRRHHGRAAGRAVALPAPAACLSLFLDIDGTLLDIASTPEGVVVPRELGTTLARLGAGLGGAVAILTGRTIADADELLAPLRLVTAGVHGTELRLEHGGAIDRVASRMSEALLAEVRDVARLDPGIIVEMKGAGVAVHYRNAPAASEVLEAELARILAGSGSGLKLTRGRMVFEIVPSDISKGTALATIAARAPFADRVPVMIGDDRSDEPALAAAERLGGAGLKVAGEHFAAAGADFAGPSEVLSFLDDLARQLDA